VDWGCLMPKKKNSLKLPQPVLHKTIFQVQYNPQLSFFELLFTAAQRITVFPNDWETNGISVVLRDTTKHCSLSIMHNIITYEQDSNDIGMEAEYIQHIFSILPQNLEIDILKRFGYRRIYLVNLDMSFEELVNIMDLKLFAQDPEFKRIIPNQLTDLLYRVDASEGEYSYHVTAGPVRKNEIPLRIAYNQNHHLALQERSEAHKAIIDSYPNVAIYIDIDFYQGDKDLPVNEILSFADIARLKMTNYANDFAKYLLNDKLEL
jgi:hypothetical protein